VDGRLPVVIEGVPDGSEPALKQRLLEEEPVHTDASTQTHESRQNEEAQAGEAEVPL